MLPGFARNSVRAKARSAFAMVFFLLPPWLPAQTLGLSYAPEAVFRGDPATFRLQGAVETVPLTVHTNGAPAATMSLGKDATEFTFRPEDSTRLRFSVPGRDIELFLVLPGDPVRFSERDGYLLADSIPALLLPDHRKPPPLDRRWETGRLLKETFVDSRPRLGQILWLGRPGPDALAIAGRLSKQDPVFLPPDPEAWFRVHGYLMATPPGSADFLVVDFDAYDLERGVPPHILIMKWQFLLQRLRQQSAAADGLLLGPVLDPVDRSRLAPLDEALRSLARSHGLRFIDRNLPAGEWNARLLNNLNKEYRLP